MPKPIAVTGAILYENHPPPVRGAASFSDGRYYEFSGNVEDGFHFVTAPAWRTNRTRWFDNPARDAALHSWFRGKDAANAATS